ncbi:hypothetical protein L9W80_00090 [Vibrio aestuarianus]|uniref:hypothetical protein n=1 Tax=Vibrio aestuarianus TaxID=28171 RepID=UPI00237CCEB6|nr:hypothetical protein [Vibrio aestuarianus]MDE1348541.1 hypothetical protein [Vibrio aestuarianus]
MQKKHFYIEVAAKQLVLLLFIAPMLFSNSFDSMRHMEQSNQSAILAVVGLLMAAGIIGVFEATYQKTQLNNRLQRTLAHLTKLLLFTGVSELIILAIAAIGITSTVWDDPLLWAILPIYASLYVFDWWDALIAASVSTPEFKLEPDPKQKLQVESDPLPKSEIQSKPEVKSED